MRVREASISAEWRYHFRDVLAFRIRYCVSIDAGEGRRRELRDDLRMATAREIASASPLHYAGFSLIFRCRDGENK